MTVKYYRLLILFIFFFLAPNVFSQKDTSYFVFTSRNFYKPFASEISSTLNNISFGVVESNKFSGRGRKKLVINEIHLGVDVPLLYAKNSNFKWAMFIPVSIHMIWYPVEKTTSPIINSDYRFGLSFTGITNLNNRYIKNFSFEIKPFAHESTHLGDEITISGFQDDKNFFRVNVSYEYYELGLTINDPEVLNENTLSFRFGFMGLINPKKGYYTLYENEIGDNTLYPGRRSGEFYTSINYKGVSGFLTNKRWQPNVSVELRNRVKYDYVSAEKENRIWCVNAYAGYNYVPKMLSAIKSTGHYIRYYYGVVPHGQLRNGTCYFIGYSLILKI